MRLFVLWIALAILPASCKSTGGSKGQPPAPGTIPTGDPTASDPAAPGASEEQVQDREHYTLRITSPRVVIAPQPQSVGSLELKRKGVVSSIKARTLEGACVATPAETASNSGLYTLGVSCAKKESCKVELQVLVPTASLNEKTAFQLSCVQGTIRPGESHQEPGATPDTTLKFSFTDPQNNKKVTGLVEGKTAYILQTRGSLVGKFSYSANANLGFINKDKAGAPDPTLKSGCESLPALAKAAPSAVPYIGWSSSALFKGFQSPETPAPDLVELAKSAAAKAGASGITNVAFFTGEDYFGFTHLAGSLSDFMLTAGYKSDAATVENAMNSFLRSIISDLFIGSLCDLVNGTGIIAKDKEGNPGPAVLIQYVP